MYHDKLFWKWREIDREGFAFARLFGAMEACQSSLLSQQKAEAADIFFEEVARIVEEEEKRKGGMQS